MFDSMFDDCKEIEGSIGMEFGSLNVFINQSRFIKDDWII